MFDGTLAGRPPLPAMLILEAVDLISSRRHWGRCMLKRPGIFGWRYCGFGAVQEAARRRGDFRSSSGVYLAQAALDLEAQRQGFKSFIKLNDLPCRNLGHPHVLQTMRTAAARLTGGKALADVTQLAEARS